MSQVTQLSLMKDIKKLDKRFNGHVAVEFKDDDNSTNLTLTMFIPDGVHAGATYTFDVIEMKSVYCMTPIHHPNIVEGDAVCCNILYGGDEWNENLTLTHLVATLYALINTPNFDEPLWDESDDYDDDLYEENVRQHLIDNDNYNPNEGGA
jgi:ubiquitin-protein ligase